MDLGSIQIQSGDLKTFNTSFTELWDAYTIQDGFYYLKFSVLDETNLNVTLSDLSGDFDLYVGEINPNTNAPFFDVDNDTATVYNSSTNPGKESENIFASLRPGDYWLQIRPQGDIALEALEAKFELALNGQSFDKATVLSNDELLDKQ